MTVGPDPGTGLDLRTPCERLRAVDRAEAARTARGALGLFRERSWLAALVGVILLTTLFVALGRWQERRHEQRSARNDLVTANFDAVPVPLAELADLGRPGGTLSPGLEWRPVVVTGRYLPAATVVIRNRPRDRVSGYLVVTPLRTSEGRVLMVDRGWIPAGATGARPDAVPEPPGGDVRVVVRARPAEPPSERTAPPGQAMRIVPGSLAAGLDPALRDDVLGWYGRLAEESPRGPDAPLPLPRPEAGTGINLAYAYQWWGFALVGYVLLGVAAVREVRRRADRPESDGPDPDGPEPDGPEPDRAEDGLGRTGDRV